MIPKKYKGLHKKEAAVILATGPTLDDFSFDLIPENNFKTIGVNSILYKNINLDYYFCAQDPSKEKNHKHKDLEKKDPLFQRILKIKNKTQIFCADGYKEENSSHQNHQEFFSETEREKMNCETYSLTHNLIFEEDLSQCSLLNHSIVFPAVQFAMYCGFSKVYLVGCDCGGGGSYIEKNSKNSDLNGFINIWGQIKYYRYKLYKETELISINPIGLKDVFPYISN
tara:strand:+ start:441 stop:1118 length:678 start_codon:yes stop_codon:yes gene_type:complete